MNQGPVAYLEHTMDISEVTAATLQTSVDGQLEQTLEAQESFQSDENQT